MCTSNEQPLVSIVMPAYNCEKYIADAINSVIEQTYKNWELFVIDDCSTDNTESIARSFKDPRVVCLKNTENSGPAVSRNRGIEAAKGEYIAFLDSDDVWLPKKLEHQISFMQNEGVNFSCTAYGIMDAEGYITDRKVIPFKRAGYKRCLYYGNCIGNSTAIYKVGKDKFFVPQIRKRNDFALWLKILKREKYCFGIKEMLAYYRVRENSVSSNKKTLIKYQWELYRKIEKLPMAVCCFALCTLAIRKAVNYIHRG